MGLLTHGLAVGFGYLLGRPDGRARLARLGRQAADLAQRPEVARARERVQDQVKDQASAVKEKVAARTNGAKAAGSDEARSTTAPALPKPAGRTWRSRFSRAGTAHFPSSSEAAEAQGTADAATPPLGTVVTPRPEAPTPRP